MMQYICSNCGAQFDEPVRKPRGCGDVLLLALLAFITLPTIILPILIAVIDHILYKKSIKKVYCPECDKADCILPTSTPKGRRLAEQYA